MKDLLAAQGADPTPLEDPTLFPQVKIIHSFTSPHKHYISRLDTMKMGLTADQLGAGRKKKNEPMDHAMGIAVHNKTGERVEEGKDLACTHTHRPEDLERARAWLRAS